MIQSSLLPDGTIRKYWDGLARSLDCERRQLSGRLQLNLISEDADLLLKATPYFAAAIADRIYQDLITGSRIASLLPNKGLFVPTGQESYDGQVCSISAPFEGQFRTAVCKVIGHNESEKCDLSFQINSAPEFLAHRMFYFFLDLATDKVTEDFNKTLLGTVLPYRGLQLVSKPIQHTR